MLLPLLLPLWLLLFAKYLFLFVLALSLSLALVLESIARLSCIAHSHCAYSRTKWIDLLLWAKNSAILFHTQIHKWNPLRLLCSHVRTVWTLRVQNGEIESERKKWSVCVYNIHNINAVIEIILNISLRAHTLHFIFAGVENCEIRIIPHGSRSHCCCCCRCCCWHYHRHCYAATAGGGVLRLEQYCSCSCPCSCIPCHRPSSRRALYWTAHIWYIFRQCMANEPKIYVRLILV